MSYLNPDNRSDLYTILAFADPAETSALGATRDVGSPFADSVDMNIDFGFGSHHWQHSAEFMSTFDEVG